MGQGSRVLALAYKALDPKEWDSVGAVRSRLGRARAEQGLRFGGFLVLGCPLKPDAAYVVGEVRRSGHTAVMITGDGALTAADVARRVGMIDEPPVRALVLAPATVAAAATSGGERLGAGVGMKFVSPRKASESSGGEWGRSRSGKDQAGASGIPLDLDSLDKLAEGHTLCVTGATLSRLAGGAVDVHRDRVDEGSETESLLASSSTPAGTGQGDGSVLASTLGPASALSKLCPHVSIFARVSPDQKERVVVELNASGRTTLMCGDGTNDVGALRRAHVGVSIINSPEMEKRLQGYVDGPKGKGRGGTQGGGGLDDGTSSSSSCEEMRSKALVLVEAQEQDMDPTLVRLGDASIASPFTAKTTSVGCVLTIIRQGRCTLVTTLQVYKILALNCLTSAYQLSALYLHGVKQGDGQMTILGLVISAFFFLTSRARPVERLSTSRPPSRVLCLPLCLSIAGQFSAHLAALLMVTALCRGHVDAEDPSVAPDGPFRPNTFNTAVFLLSFVMQVNTFAANYSGQPFMEPLRENKPMWWLVIATYVILAGVATGFLPWLDSWLQLSPLQPEFRGPLVGVLVADTAVTYAVEALVRRFL
ncbi:unnamed protein product [Discosporangium mesarthrocarpum]